MTIVLRKKKRSTLSTLLSKYGTNAHVWLPGANGTTVASLPSNNYLLSDGSTGYSTVDGVVGLDLDGMGALGSELVTNGSFATNDLTGWATLAGTWSAATGAAVCTAGTNSTISQNILTVGRTYQITLDVASLTGTLFVYAGASAASSFTTTGTKTVYLRCWGDTVFYVQFSSSSTGSVDNISVREITGIHASQATTANKPILRRGLVNLLTYSNDLTNAAWADYRSCSVSGQTITEAAASATHFVQRVTAFATTTGVAYTTAYIAKANGRNFFTAVGDANTSYLGGPCRWNLTTGANTVTGSGCTASSADLGGGWFLFTISSTATGTGTTARPGIALALDGTTSPTTFQSYLGDGVSGIMVNGVGLFQGTYTAQQIIAQGGIPVTTTAAASNPLAGSYSWSFDGSNDSLLTGNLGITNTVTVVIAGVLNTLPAVSLLVCEDANGARLGVSSTGAVSFDKNGVAALVATAAGVIVAGVPFVLTARLQAGNADIRKAGAQIATAASALTFSATAGMRIGTRFDGVTYPCNGSIFAVQVITATTTDADCLAIERLVAQQAGITI